MLMDMFGGKLTGGIFAIIGAIISVILIGIMAGPFGSLVSYFGDSASDSDGQRFSRVYAQVTGDTIPNEYQINTDTNRAGGSGYLLTGVDVGGVVTFGPISATVRTDNGFPAFVASATITVYNEQGVPVVVEEGAAVTNALELQNVTWQSPPDAFGKLNFLNRILCTILALVAAIGLIMKVKNSYDAFQRGGSGDLTPVVLTEVTTMVLALVGVYFTPTFLNIIGQTAQTYTSGQFDFGFVDNILEIVFAILPTMLLIGLMGLVSAEQVQKKLIGYGRSAVGRANPMRYRRGRRAMAM
jgi:hypothetical protein